MSPKSLEATDLNPLKLSAMKINRDEFLSALAGPAKLAGKRTTLPILNHVLLQAAGNELFITGSNLDAFEEARIACDGDLGAVCVPAAKLCDVLKRLGPEVEITNDKKRLMLVGGARVHLSTASADEFPKFPDTKGKAIGINAAALADGIESVAWATAVDGEGRFNLEHIYVQSGADGVRCIATNGRQLAKHETNTASNDAELLVHYAFAGDVVAALRRDGAAISQGDNWLCVTHAGGQLAVKRSEVQFPNWKQVIPDAKSIGTVNKADFTKALALALAIPSDKTTAVTLDFGAAGMTLTRKAAEDEVESTVPGKFAAFKFCADMRYLNAGLRALGDEIEVSGIDAVSPIALKSGNLLFILMGLRLS